MWKIIVSSTRFFNHYALPTAGSAAAERAEGARLLQAIYEKADSDRNSITEVWYSDSNLEELRREVGNAVDRIEEAIGLADSLMQASKRSISPDQEALLAIVQSIV